MTEHRHIGKKAVGGQRQRLTQLEGKESHLREALRHGTAFHSELLEEINLADTLILNSGLQNCERKHFWGFFRAPSLWEFVTAALES